MKSYVLGKIKIHKVREKFQLTKYDLFILIKYVKFNELSTTINNDILTFVKDESREGTGDKIIFFSDDVKEYIKDTFNNLSGLFEEYNSFTENAISRSFQNLIMVIGLIKWKEPELSYFRNQIIKIIPLNHFPNSNYNLIRTTIKFIYIQLKLYRINSPEFINVILGIISSNPLMLYHYDDIHKVLLLACKYSQATNSLLNFDVELLQKSLIFLNKDYKYNKKFLQKIFLPIYQISNEEIKELFTPYFKELRISKWEEVKEENLYDEIFRELDFLQYGCEPSQEFIKFMTNWVEKLDSTVFSSYKLQERSGAERILEFINFLVKEKGLSQLKKLQKLLQEKIQSIINDINKSKNI